MPGFVLLVRPRNDGDPAMRLGLTVSKKVGNAVTRNRMKRRFRELARAILPEAGHAGADHVLIGRQNGIERDYALLADELRKALAKLKGKTVRAEPVEALPFSLSEKKDSPSTSSGRTDSAHS
ncbi:ribonuclease P protein component [Allosphingosinicella sp.]|uniref:ribonuclease P protein component n=1 Tax=Allosphingosinicella sp. TaxID=2823234 RepID=UPI003783AFEA